MSYASRPLTSLAEDLDGLHARCARISDMSFGLSLIFAALVVASVGGGLWLREPLLATSAGFALVATAAFGVVGQTLARAAEQAPRLRIAVATPLRTDRRLD